VIYNSQQILPCYSVVCKFEFENELGKELCIECSLQAEKYCEQDQAYFCSDCDAIFHESNEGFAAVLRKHNRIAISEKKVSFGDCKDHSRAIEFFCVECKKPLCANCKVMGNHASGDSANHTIVDIMETYLRAKKDAEDDDLELKKKKGGIQSCISKTQQKIAYV